MLVGRVRLGGRGRRWGAAFSAYFLGLPGGSRGWGVGGSTAAGRSRRIQTDQSVRLSSRTLEDSPVNATQNRPGRPVDQQLWGRRCDEILGVAAKLFAEKGYDHADTQELADRVGVGKGTLY